MTCPQCSRQIVQPPTGRRRKTCSDRCRKAAERTRPGLTLAALARRLEVAPELAAAIVEPLIAAGLVEHADDSRYVLRDPDVRAAYGPDPGRCVPLDDDDLPMPRRGPAHGTPRPVRELVAA